MGNRFRLWAFPPLFSQHLMHTSIWNICNIIHAIGKLSSTAGLLKQAVSHSVTPPWQYVLEQHFKEENQT